MKSLCIFLKKHNFLVDTDALNLNQFNSHGETPVMMAIKENDLRAVMEILEYGGNKLDINIKRHSDGITAFMLAVAYNFLDIVQELLDVSTLEINAQNKSGETALYMAAESGLKPIILEILEAKKHVVYDLDSCQNKNAYCIAIENMYPDIANDIKSKAKIPEQSTSAVIVKDNSLTILPSYNQFIVAYGNLSNNNQNRASLEHLKNEGFYLIQDLQKALEKNISLAAGIDKNWFLVYKKKFESWGNSVNGLLKEKRDESARLDKSFVFDFNQDLNRNDHAIFLSMKSLWALSIESYENSRAVLYSMVPNGLKDRREIEGLENKVILSLMTIQTIIEVCFEIKNKPGSNSSLFHSLEIFIKICEEQLIKIQENIDQEYILITKKYAEMEEKIIFINSVEIELKADEPPNPLFAQCSKKREEAFLKQQGYNCYAMILLRQMRFGLFPKQHQVSLRNTQKMNRLFKDSLSPAQQNCPCLSPGEILELKNDTINLDVDLVQVWSNRAHKNKIEKMLFMSTLKETALSEQLNFFYDQARFLKEFCSEFDIKCFFSGMDHGYLKKCPLYFSIATLLPKGSDFFALYYIATSEKNITAPIIEDNMYEIENLNIELADMEKIIAEYMVAIEKLNFEISEAQSKKDEFLTQKNNLLIQKKELFNSFSSYRIPLEDDDFLTLYEINDAALDHANSESEDVTSRMQSIHSHIYCLSDEVKMAGENYRELSGSFQPLFNDVMQASSTYENLRAERKDYIDEYYALVDRSIKLIPKIKALEEKTALNSKKIRELESSYFENKSNIEDLDANIEDLLTLIKDNKKQLEIYEEEYNNTILQKKGTQDRLDINNQYYVHLHQITQKVLLQKTLLGQQSELEREGLRDASDEAKEKSKADLEDACILLVQIITNSFGEIWNQNPSTMIKNLEKLSGYLRQQNDLFVKKLIASFMKAEYSRQYIGSKISEFEMLFEVLDTLLMINLLFKLVTKNKNF